MDLRFDDDGVGVAVVGDDEAHLGDRLLFVSLDVEADGVGEAAHLEPVHRAEFVGELGGELDPAALVEADREEVLEVVFAVDLLDVLVDPFSAVGDGLVAGALEVGGVLGEDGTNRAREEEGDAECEGARGHMRIVG